MTDTAQLTALIAAQAQEIEDEHARAEQWKSSCKRAEERALKQQHRAEAAEARAGRVEAVYDVSVRHTAVELIGRLERSITTASNDDLSEPMTELRNRHVARIGAMQDAAAVFTDIAAECDYLRRTVGAFEAEQDRLIAEKAHLAAMLRDFEKAAQGFLDCGDGSERGYLIEEMAKARAALAKEGEK